MSKAHLKKPTPWLFIIPGLDKLIFQTRGRSPCYGKSLLVGGFNPSEKY